MPTTLVYHHPRKGRGAGKTRLFWSVFFLTSSRLLAQLPDGLPRLDEPVSPNEPVTNRGDLFEAFPNLSDPATQAVPDELRQLIYEGALEDEAPVAAPEPPPVVIPPEMLELARKIIDKVVFLQAWDGYGEELARGCGFFVDAKGAVATDLSLVRPEIADRLEYITVTTGEGKRHRVTGFHRQEIKAGFAILETDARDTAFLKLNIATDFSKESPVRILAYHPLRGLAMADAFAQVDGTRAGQGWLNLHGRDSSGEPGSPLINDKGEVVGMVAMRVPQKEWFNFGSTIAGLAQALEKGWPEKSAPLTRLATSTTNPVVNDQRFLSAFENLYNGNSRQAISELLLLRRIYPRSAEVWALLGLACEKIGAKQDALNCHRKAVALNPDAGQYWFQLGATAAAGQSNAAHLEALQRTVEERPADRFAWLLLAKRQLAEKKYPDADRALLQVLKLGPGDASTLFLVAYAKSKLGDLSAAETAARQSLAANRKDARTWFFLGLLHTAQKRLPDAVQAFQQAVEIEPRHPHAWLNLARLQRRLGRSTEATLAFAEHQRVTAKAR